MKKIGFIGMGNMAGAIATGFIKTQAGTKETILAFAPHKEKLVSNSEKIGFTPVYTVTELVEKSDVIIMGCKPYQIESVIEEVGKLFDDKMLISIAAGWPFAKYQELLPNTRIQFVMPNTPAMVGEGVFLFEETNSLTECELAWAKEIFNKLGEVISLPSRLMGIGGTITGCGPAFMDMIIEAYGDAAVKYGIARDLAYKMVAKTMLGSAELLLATGKHPGQLKDEVCSPGGTTICGVAALEKEGLRNACIASVEAVMNKR